MERSAASVRIVDDPTARVCDKRILARLEPNIGVCISPFRLIARRLARSGPGMPTMGSANHGFLLYCEVPVEVEGETRVQLMIALGSACAADGQYRPYNSATL